MALMSDAPRKEPKPSLVHDAFARINWARNDRHLLVERLNESIELIQRANGVIHEVREAITHGGS
jgi:hypothetical protein